MLVLAMPRSNMRRAATSMMRARVVSPLRVNRDAGWSGTVPPLAVESAGFPGRAPGPRTGRWTRSPLGGIGGERAEVVDRETDRVRMRPFRPVGEGQGAPSLVSADDDQRELSRIGSSHQNAAV